jgi:protease-4
MFRQIQSFRRETSKPVYISMQTVAASGGYYIAMAADKVYATPTTITGSIGVIGTFPELKDLMDRFGVKVNSIKSGPNKDDGAFYRTMTPEDREQYQSMIDDMYEQFFEKVSANRSGIAEDRLRMLADGSVYTANQALAEGLIDGIAYLDQVLDIVEAEQKLDEPEVVLYKRTGASRADSLYAMDLGAIAEANTEASGTQVNIINIDGSAFETPTNEVFNYLWIP